MYKSNSKLKTVLVFFLISLIFLFSHYKSHKNIDILNKTPTTNQDISDESVNNLKFSNTATWDLQFLMFIDNKTLFLPSNWQEKIHLDEPKANNSPETKKELQDLLYLKSKRDKITLENITKEKDFKTTFFGDLTINDYLTDMKKFPKTSALLSPIFGNDLNVVIFTLKNNFDRVRPNVLEKNIEPAIDVPQHPAYPSGHSTQTHLLALILSQLSPKRKVMFENRADEISFHREVAGLHYHSDSVAGQLVAQQIMDMLLQNPDFVKLLNDSKSEWKD